MVTADDKVNRHLLQFNKSTISFSC